MARGITISILILLVLLLGSTFISIYIRFVLSKTRDTPKELYDRIIKILGQGKEKKFIDLGAGSFDLVFSVEKAGFQAYGVEISPLLVVIGKIKKIFKRSKADIKQKNMYKIYLKEFDIIYINQQDDHLITLRNKLSVECRENCEIYLFNKAFPGLKAERTFKLDQKNTLNKYKGKQFKE